MKATRFLAVTVLIAALTSFALAAGVTGLWKGHFVIDASKAEKLTPDQDQALKKEIAQAKTMVISLTLSPNKSFVGSMTGRPPQSGTWAQTGNAITITSKDKSGKSSSQTFTLSKDGKLLTLSLGTFKGISSKIQFSR